MHDQNSTCFIDLLDEFSDITSSLACDIRFGLSLGLARRGPSCSYSGSLAKIRDLSYVLLKKKNT